MEGVLLKITYIGPPLFGLVFVSSMEVRTQKQNKKISFNSEILC